jgi:hypothetical protein
MQFRTQISIPKSDFPIGYDSMVVSLGSCFAVNMAEKLEYLKFQNAVNPFGILFHPIAIENFLDFAVNGKRLSEKDAFFHQERWHSFATHSDLSNSNKAIFLQKANAAIDATQNQITTATHIIITYGTAWVYREKTSVNVVANCHKLPQQQFDKEILSVESIFNSIQNTIALIQKINPTAQIIFTVSPVRHFKDGFPENQWSKSNLISALQSAIKGQASSNLTYFPSYEIMMDELRDYRFYAEDMMHPSQIAIDYIWKRFTDTTISEAAQVVMEKIATIQKGRAHRPFNEDSESHQKFLAKLGDSITDLQQQFPHMNF